MWTEFFVVFGLVLCMILGPLFSFRAYKHLTDKKMNDLDQKQ